MIKGSVLDDWSPTGSESERLNPIFQNQKGAYIIEFSINILFYSFA